MVETSGTMTLSRAYEDWSEHENMKIDYIEMTNFWAKVIEWEYVAWRLMYIYQAVTRASYITLSSVHSYSLSFYVDRIADRPPFL